MNLFEGITSKITRQDQKVILEAVESRAIELAESRVEAVEKEYSEKFAALTESVSSTIVDVVEKSVEQNANKIVKDKSVEFLMESVSKIQSILEDIGLTVNPVDSVEKRVVDTESKLSRSVELLKKAKEIADKNVNKINNLKVELYIRKSLSKGFNPDMIESAVKYFSEQDIELDEIEDELALWLEKQSIEHNNLSAVPRESNLADAGIDEESLNKELQDLDDMLGKNLFESTEETKVNKPEELDAPVFEGIKPMKTRFGNMSDVSSAQLETIVDEGSEYVTEDLEILSQDVDDAVKSIKKFGNWAL